MIIFPVYIEPTGIVGPLGATGPEEAQKQADYYFAVKRFLGAKGIIGAQPKQMCWACDEKSRHVAEFFDVTYCVGKLRPEESCWPSWWKKEEDQ